MTLWQRIFRVTLWATLMALGLGLLIWSGWDLDRIFGLLPSMHPGWFFLAMSLLPLAGFPIAIFYLYAGSTYGFWAGWGLCLLALSVNFSASYLIGRTLLRQPLTDCLTRRGHALPELATINQFRFTFLLRTVPGPPFPVQNYLLAVIGVRFRIYWTISLLAQGTLAAGMVSIGHYTTVSRTRIYVIVTLVLLGILLLLRRWFQHQKSRKLAPGAD